MPPRLTTDYLKSLAKNGSWPYFEGNKPATEPTVVCAIACSDDDSVCEGALQFLLSIRNPDGGWSSGEGLGESDWNTGLALFGLSRLSTALKSRKKFSRDLEEKYLRSYNESISKLIELRMDSISALSRTVLTAIQGPDFDYPRGWPWEQKTHNWVEPTAYSLLAIKAGELSGEKRIATAVAQAHKYLFEKSCKAGGWNWGQTRTLGFDFPPVTRDTALALLALQDQPEHEKVVAGVNVLRAATADGAGEIEPLAVLALDALGEDVSNISGALVKNYRAPQYGGENLVPLAYATMAANVKAGNPLRLRASA